jgi:hypothetical protein
MKKKEVKRSKQVAVIPQKRIQTAEGKRRAMLREMRMVKSKAA